MTLEIKDTNGNPVETLGPQIAWPGRSAFAGTTVVVTAKSELQKNGNPVGDSRTECTDTIELDGVGPR